MRENEELLVRLWEKTVDVQMHFNDIEMRIRNFATTAMAAFLSAIGYTLNKGVVFTLGGLSYPLGLALAVTALIVWTAFYFMDRHWYHRLLYGSVKYGGALEDKLSELGGDAIPKGGLTDAIGEESRIVFPRLGFKLRSKGKLDLFYGVGAFIFLVLAYALYPADPATAASDIAALATNSVL